MSLGRGVLLGSQEPRVRNVPAWHSSDDGLDAVELAAGYGLVADDWQADIVECWSARKRDGRLAAGRCGLSVPRQNGKNAVLEIVELHRIVMLGRKVLHTAHEVKTARKAFLRLLSFFENPRQYPELAALVPDGGIRKTNGQEAVLLTNGGSVEFVARSRGSGRGFTVDDLVLDEAQELTDEQLDALMPTISAAPSGDPQIILTGTPPGPNSPGEVFTRTRDAGVGGKDRRLAWHEWSVVGRVDVADRALAAATNPALGRRLSASVVEDELAQMSPDGFARERLGRWASADLLAAIPPAEWAGCVTSEPPRSGQTAFAVDMSPDRSILSISACRVGADGVPHIEVVRNESTATGTAWASAWLAERKGKALAVLVDSQSPAMALVPDLSAARVPVTVSGAGDMVKACGLFLDRVKAGEVTHFDQPVLNAAVAGVRKRDIGSAGGFGWDRRAPDVDLTPLVSCTLALYGALTNQRQPSGRVPRRIY